jgi:hypothetical protein
MLWAMLAHSRTRSSKRSLAICSISQAGVVIFWVLI